VDTIRIGNLDYNLDMLRNCRIASVSPLVKVVLICLVELESVIEQQNQALRIQATAPPRPVPQFDERRPSTSSVFSLPSIQQHSPATRRSYVPICSRPQDRPYEETQRSMQRHDATGLDHLADVAATSPPASDKRSPTSNLDIDPSLGNSTVSFPSFPHDIFISNIPSNVTPTRETEIEFPTVDHHTGALLPFGSEAEGLPPKEILEIMFVRP
jgi:hypothetical protein